MKIGVLNELLKDISFNSSVPSDICGNPAKGETSFVKWNVVRNGEVSYAFDFGETVFLDGAEVSLGEKTKLKCITLKNENKILYSHRAETGKTPMEVRYAYAA